MKKIQANRLFRYLCFFIMGLVFSSCIFEKGDHNDEPDTYGDGSVTIIVRLSPLAMSGAGNSEVVEKIGSFRLLMLSENGVEANIYKSWEGGSYNAENFTYTLRLQAEAGTKQFYFFANEENVSAISYQAPSGVTLPGNLPTNLTTLLESFTENDNDNDNNTSGYTASQVSDILNSIYYQPKYNITNNSVFLPYSCYYEKEAIASTPENPFINEYTMYLVPEAVKFTFKFINNRFNQLNIEEIKISGNGNLSGVTYPEKAGISDSNFLVGSVNQKDYNKSYNGIEYYWIDWLAQIAELSHEHPGADSNAAFNNLFGWIDDYNLPLTSSPAEVTLLDSGNTLNLPGTNMDNVTTDNTPVFAGPYYLPESKNEVSFIGKDDEGKDVNISQQQYYLSLGIIDPASTEAPPLFQNVVINNLKALFRDTHEFITIRFTEGDVEVFAEIAPWSRKKANGWVVGGN